MASFQRDLFAVETPRCDAQLGGLQRTDLGAGAWIDHRAEWIEGHAALLDARWTATRWQAHRRRMYDRVVDVPRLVASWPDDGPGHPLIPDLARARSRHPGRPPPRLSRAHHPAPPPARPGTRPARSRATTAARCPASPSRPTAPAGTASPSTAIAWAPRA